METAFFRFKIRVHMMYANTRSAERAMGARCDSVDDNTICTVYSAEHFLLFVLFILIEQTAGKPSIVRK